MNVNRSIRASLGMLILAILCQGQSCSSVVLPPFAQDALLDGEVVASDFTLAAASTVAVEAGAIGTAHTAVSVDDDLSDEEDGVYFTIDPSDISVSVDEAPSNAQRRNLSARAVERFATITLRIAVSGDDACDSDADVGPFELIIANGAITGRLKCAVERRVFSVGEFPPGNSRSSR